MTISCIRYKGEGFQLAPCLIHSFRTKEGKTKQKSFYLGIDFKATEKQIEEFYRDYPGAKSLDIDWTKVRNKIVPTIVISLDSSWFRKK